MMKQLFSLLFLFSLIASKNVCAQGVPITPSNSVSVTDTSGEFSTENELIFLHNNRADSIKVGWRFLTDTADAAWQFQLCDNYQCYAMPIAPKVSLPIAPGDSLNMHAIITANCISGSGVMHVSAEVVGDTGAAMQLTYTAHLTSTCVTGISNLNPETAISVFPNPANDRITVSGTDPNHELLIQIIDLQGRVVFSENKAAGPLVEISINGVAAGFYFVKVGDKQSNLSSSDKFFKF
jgi:hypothetical protein